VFIVTRCKKLQDDVRDKKGHMTAPACGFVQGLRAAGVPACVLHDKTSDAWQAVVSLLPFLSFVKKGNHFGLRHWFVMPQLAY
jgi:hypothetical protein